MHNGLPFPDSKDRQIDVNYTNVFDQNQIDSDPNGFAIWISLSVGVIYGVP